MTAVFFQMMQAFMERLVSKGRRTQSKLSQIQQGDYKHGNEVLNPAYTNSLILATSQKYGTTSRCAHVYFMPTAAPLVPFSAASPTEPLSGIAQIEVLQKHNLPSDAQPQYTRNPTMNMCYA